MATTVFFDIDSQLDFLYPAGALYVPGAERIVPAVARLNRFAAGRGIPVVSTTDAHAENDPEFAAWPPHCIAGTLGQRKARSDATGRRVAIPNRACGFSIAGADQIIFEKQTVNVFRTETIRPLVERLERRPLRGLRRGDGGLRALRRARIVSTGKPVRVVEDALECLTAAASEKALEELRSLGATVATVASVIEPGP